MKDFEAVLRVHPADPEGYAGRAAARVRLGRIREALADAEESLRQARSHAPALLHRRPDLHPGVGPRRRRGGPQRPVCHPRLTGLRGPRRRLPRRGAGADARRPAHPLLRDVVARDVLLRPLLRNPSIVRRLQPGDAADALSQRAPRSRAETERLKKSPLTKGGYRGVLLRPIAQGMTGIHPPGPPFVRGEVLEVEAILSDPFEAR